MSSNEQFQAWKSVVINYLELLGYEVGNQPNSPYRGKHNRHADTLIILRLFFLDLCGHDRKEGQKAVALKICTL
jgi:hypothetical protein